MVSVSSVKDKASDTAEQLRQLKAQVEALMSDRVTPAIADAADRAESTYRSASKTLHEKADQLSDRVQDKPLVAILIAAGAGWLIGRLFR